MKDYLARINDTAAMLLKQYHELMPHITFRRGLDECLAAEDAKLSELREMYGSKLGQMRYLSARYIDDHSEFARCQDVHPKYFTLKFQELFFISHRWATAEHPDPQNYQFQAFRSYFYDLVPKADRDRYAFWYDYSCMPQVDRNGGRTDAEESEFAESLRVMHLLPTLARTIIIWADGYLDRTWCCAEWIWASRISPVMPPGERRFPLGNAIKFRQMALVVLFLAAPKQRDLILGSEDRYAIAFLNSLLMSTMRDTESLLPADKAFINLALHRHFWYHVRMLGLRTELMIGLLLLRQYEDPHIELWLKEFLLISADPDLQWATHASFEIDTMIIDQKDPFTDLEFHNRRIIVKSQSTS